MLRQLESIMYGVPTHRSGVEDPMEEDPRAQASSRHPSSTASSSSSASSGGPGLNNQENELERLKRLQEMETDKSSSSGSSLALNEADAEDDDEDDDDVLLSTLPKELLVEIFGFCSVKDVCTARGVSRSWRRLIEHDALLWRRLGRQHLALYDIEEFMTPSELKLQADGPPDATNWVHIYQRVFGGGWDDTPQTGTTLSDNGRTISYLPGDAGYRCFISKRAFDKGKHYIEVHFKTLKEGFDKGVRDSNTYGFGLANRTIYTINGGSSYLSSNNGRGWYDNGNAYNIDDENTTLEFPHWKEKDTLGVFLDFDENKAAFFMNRERVTKYFKIYSDLPLGPAPQAAAASTTTEAATAATSSSPGASGAGAAASLATSPPAGIHIACLTAKGGEWTLRYCGSCPPLDVAVGLA